MAKLTSFQASLVCVVLRSISAFLKSIPMPVALWIGRRLGECSYWLYPKNRRKVYQHLRIAFGRIKTAGEIDKIARDVYRSYGQNIVEIARLTLFAQQGSENYVTVKGREYVDAAMKHGRGLIFLSIHSGNWELSNIVGSQSGYPYNMVANYLEHVNSVADLLDSWRMSAGCKIINPGIGGRDIIKALKRNEIVTLVADQGGSDGMMIPFLGRAASLSTGAVRIALKYDVPVCLVDIHRLPTGGHCLEVLPFELSNTHDTDLDLKNNMLRIAQQFQEWIYHHPCEYLWFYKTWKYAHDRIILILDDGRTGHLRQSQSLARQMTGALMEKGRSVSLETITVEWRSGMAVVFFWLLSELRPLFFGMGLRILRFFLTVESYALIASLKPDVVISCGSKNSWLNVWVAEDNEARNICILRPGGPRSKDFDLQVMPRHDVKGKLAGNTVLTKVAPNLIDKQYLDDSVKGLISRFSHLKLHSRPRIGLLIGGDTKGLVLTEQQVRIVIHQLKEAAQKFSADILVTTSRRTSGEVEALVIREFSNYSRGALLIIANKNNVAEAVGGILGLSDIIVVSGESISMLSEAAMSGKKTIVFPVDGSDHKPLDNKYLQFSNMLGNAGHVVSVRTTGVADAVDRLLRDKIKTIPIDDNADLRDAVRKIII